MAMQINYNKSITANRKIPLEALIKTDVFLLFRVNEISEYKDGKRTGNIAGYAYECVDEIEYKHYIIKIKGQAKPLMTNEELQQLREKKNVFVEFKNATVYCYYNKSTRGYEDSYSADDVMLVSD